MDQLAANERADVLVVEDGVEGELQVLRAIGVEVGVRRAGLAAPGLRQDGIVQQQLGVQVMMGRHQHHGVGIVRAGTETGRQATIGLVWLVIVPTSERGGKPHDNILVVGRHEIAGRIHNQRAVGPQAVKTDGEELLDLPGIILVCMCAVDETAFVVALHIEIEAHCRREGDRL